MESKVIGFAMSGNDVSSGDKFRKSERIGRSREYQPRMKTTNRDHAPDRKYRRTRSEDVDTKSGNS